MRRVSPIMFLDDIDDLRRAEADPCPHAEWRWLNCDCETRALLGICDEKVCTECGASV